MDNKFEKLFSINVNDKTEKKDKLTYLSWAWAWAEFKKVFPDATYTIVKFDGKPFFYDENTGYMVFTTVSAGGLTYEMWLPVMDSANNAMKAYPYTVKTKWKEVEVAPATMFDINKAIMRCLTKNLAMFGLGLYIYAGEDLPEDEANEKQKTAERHTEHVAPAETPRARGITPNQLKTISNYLGSDIVTKALAYYKVRTVDELTSSQASAIINRLYEEEKRGIGSND